MNTKRMGRIGLSDEEEDGLVSFMQTLTDGFMSRDSGKSARRAVRRVRQCRSRREAAYIGGWPSRGRRRRFRLASTQRCGRTRGHRRDHDPQQPTAQFPMRFRFYVLRRQGRLTRDARGCSALDRSGFLLTIIDTDGARAGETLCTFENKRQTKLGWDVVARCSNSRERWTANVSLSVKDNRLSWKSQRGTQTYLRCQREEMMAQAQ
jgi:hypothetical protein